ncbi:MAG: sigma 54-interacting transcriptional regulator [Deltaproteobacteria bacterium]|nr:sigma 54-interacting transcriptional regulator [Deltaproteobacteria bacterium]MCB9786362.1 sigma 54-interacting transcriptional regulator [Deltaproteobacteria bacterium]
MSMGTPSVRVERAIREAREARTSGEPAEALPRLAAAVALVGSGPVRRELVVGLHRERALCSLDLQDASGARAALVTALEAAGPEPGMADLVRAMLATLELMAGDARRAQSQLGERGRDRRASLVAQARVHLHQGATALAEATLQACERAPGGGSELDPPTAALRALLAVWEGRPEQARVLYDGVGTAENPHWDLVRTLLLRSLWVRTGDARYLRLAIGSAEQLRFGAGAQAVPGLKAAAAGHHAFLLLGSGEVSLALEAADESFGALGLLSLPEWPRLAVLHDLALVYRDGDRPERWQRVLDAVGDAPRAAWPERMRLMSGPRAQGALEANPYAAGVQGREHSLARVGLALLEGRTAPEAALLRGLAEAVGAHGAQWRQADGHEVACVGSAWSADEHSSRVRLALPGEETLWLHGTTESQLSGLDLDHLARLAAAARGLAGDRAREASLRGAVERAEGARREATDALERTRRGATAAVAGGSFPQIAGRSEAIRAALDKLGMLAKTPLSLLIEGPPGSGRRHLARAFHAWDSGSPERCPVLDMALVPPTTMVDTLRRLETEAAGGVFVIANGEHLTPEAASELIARIESGSVRGRAVVTLDDSERSPVADALRRSLAAGRVKLPALDTRLEDLPQLIDAVAAQVGKRPEQIGTAARAVLARRAWPGHIAELRSVLASAAVRAGKGAILPEHLEAARPDARETNLSESLDLGYHDAIRGFRRELLRHALEMTAGNRTHAAELLGVQRTYFMRLIRELGADDIRPQA